MLLKEIARKPKCKPVEHLKFGCLLVENDYYYCPRCGKVLNAGPDYQPRYCSECGQKVSFKQIEFRDDMVLELRGECKVYKMEDGK